MPSPTRHFHDLMCGLASVASRDTDGAVGDWSLYPRLSFDGRVLAFLAESGDLAAPAIPNPPDGVDRPVDVFVRTRI